MIWIENKQKKEMKLFNIRYSSIFSLFEILQSERVIDYLPI